MIALHSGSSSLIAAAPTDDLVLSIVSIVGGSIDLEIKCKESAIQF